MHLILGAVKGTGNIFQKSKKRDHYLETLFLILIAEIPYIFKGNETFDRLHEDIGATGCAILYFCFAFLKCCAAMFYFDRSSTYLLDYHVRQRF